MKRSEVISMIKDELKDFIDTYNNASDKAKIHKLWNGANGMIDMLEGVGVSCEWDYEGEFHD